MENKFSPLLWKLSSVVSRRLTMFLLASSCLLPSGFRIQIYTFLISPFLWVTGALPPGVERPARNAHHSH
jgi:hypothetical protein